MCIYEGLNLTYLRQNTYPECQPNEGSHLHPVYYKLLFIYLFIYLFVCVCVCVGGGGGGFEGWHLRNLHSWGEAKAICHRPKKHDVYISKFRNITNSPI